MCFCTGSLSFTCAAITPSYSLLTRMMLPASYLISHNPSSLPVRCIHYGPSLTVPAPFSDSSVSTHCFDHDPHGALTLLPYFTQKHTGPQPHTAVTEPLLMLASLLNCLPTSVSAFITPISLLLRDKLKSMSSALTGQASCWCGHRV